MKLFLWLLKVTNASQKVLETVSFDLTGKKTIMWEIRFLMFAIDLVYSSRISNGTI